MLKRAVRASALLALAAAVVTGCGSGPAFDVDSQPTRDMSGEWALEGGRGPLGDMRVTVGTSAGLTIGADGSFSGSLGCNTISGTLSYEGEALDLGNAVWTEMACETPSMLLEEAFLPALLDVTDAKVDGDRMVLSGPRSNIRFSRVST